MPQGRQRVCLAFGRQARAIALKVDIEIVAEHAKLIEERRLATVAQLNTLTLDAEIQVYTIPLVTLQNIQCFWFSPLCLPHPISP
jgi:hypothetical protein